MGPESQRLQGPSLEEESKSNPPPRVVHTVRNDKTGVAQKNYGESQKLWWDFDQNMMVRLEIAQNIVSLQFAYFPPYYKIQQRGTHFTGSIAVQNKMQPKQTNFQNAHAFLFPL